MTKLFSNLLKDQYLKLFLLLAMFSIVHIDNLFGISNQIYTRQLYFIILALFFLLLEIIFLFRNKGAITFHVNTIDIVFVGFYLYALVYSLFLDNVHLLHIKYITLFLYITLYFSIKGLAKKFSEIPSSYLLVFLAGIFINTIVQGCWGWFQFLDIVDSNSSYFEITGAYENPASFSFYLAVVCVISFNTVLYNNWYNAILDKSIKYLGFITILISVPLLVLTEIRNAWLMILGGIVISLILKYDIKKLYKLITEKILLKYSFIFIMIIIIGLATNFLANYKSDSTNGRLLIWKISAQMVADYPLFGVGYNEFKNVYLDYQSKWFSENDASEKEKLLADIISYPYNESYQVLLETGIIGLSLFFGLIVAVIVGFLKSYKIHHNNKAMINTIFAVLGSLFICGLFAYPLRKYSILLFFIVPIAALSAILKSQKEFQIIITRKLPLYVVNIMLISLFLFSVLVTSIRIYSLRQWKKTENITMDSDFKEREKIYTSIYPFFKYESSYLSQYGEVLFNKKEYKRALQIFKEGLSNNYSSLDNYHGLADTYERLGNFEKSEYYYLKAINMVPNRFSPKVSLMACYDNFNKQEEAVKIAKQIMDMEIKVQSRYVELARKTAEYIIDNNEEH